MKKGFRLIGLALAMVLVTTFFVACVSNGDKDSAGNGDKDNGGDNANYELVLGEYKLSQGSEIVWARYVVGMFMLGDSNHYDSNNMADAILRYTQNGFVDDADIDAMGVRAYETIDEWIEDDNWWMVEDHRFAYFKEWINGIDQYTFDMLFNFFGNSDYVSRIELDNNQLKFSGDIFSMIDAVLDDGGLDIDYSYDNKGNIKLSYSEVAVTTMKYSDNKFTVDISKLVVLLFVLNGNDPQGDDMQIFLKYPRLLEFEYVAVYGVA